MPPTAAAARKSTGGEPAEAESGAIRRVTDGVMYCIRAGQMAPGQHLSEPDLTQRFNISRGTLREALKELAAEGIVTLSRYKGAYISSLSDQSMRDLLDVLEPLCRLAARLAAEKISTAAQRSSLKAIAAGLPKLADAGGRAAYLEQRREFYDALIAIAGNEELGRVIPLARTDLFRAQFESVQSKQQHLRHARGYVQIAEAVAANDPRKAELAVKRHFEETRRTLGELPETVFGGR